jgi:hypothetical protein
MLPKPEASLDTSWVFKQFLYENVLRDLDNHFQRLRIEYMPIKGAYLICTGLARQITSRAMFDIDILVRDSDFDPVISHFSAIPGINIAEKSWPRYKKGWPFEVSFYYPFEGRTINIDIHKLINLRQRFSLPPSELFARGKKQGLWTLPCAEDALAVCLCHCFAHVSHVFSWAVFDDIALIADASIDWDKFWKIAQSTGIMAFIYYILKMYGKERMTSTIPFPGKRTLRCAYADLLFWSAGFLEVTALPRVVRRAIVELPFCRDPAGLIYDNLTRRRKKTNGGRATVNAN